MNSFEHAESIVNKGAELACEIPRLLPPDNASILVLGTALSLALETWVELFDPGRDSKQRTLGDISEFIKNATAAYAVVAAKLEQSQKN